MSTYEITMDVKVQINDAVFEQVNDDWRENFYNFNTKEEIIEYITYNMIRGWPLSSIEGFANLPDDFAKLLE